MPPSVRLLDTTHIDVVSNHEIMIPADPGVFGPDALDLVAAGKYARRHMRSVVYQVGPGERFLNCGGEAGVVVLQALKTVPDIVAMAQHSRSDISRVTEALAEHNELLDSARLKLTDGPLALPSDGTDEATGFNAYVRDFRPNVLRICDRDVTPGVLANLDAPTLRRIILPLELFSETATSDNYAEALRSAGFAPNDDWTDRGMLVFDRSAA